jgi:L-ascorbate metabolism protein UlaG (beta-lactamase superfamily)
MRITKLGHCCLVLDLPGVKLLTDPASFTATQNDITGLDAVLITHEHEDHLHIDSLKAVLAKNPTALVIGNKAVAKIVGEKIADTVVTVVGDGQSTMVKDVLIEGFGTEHALVYPPNLGLVENTGFFVANQFYFPGDNFHNPGKKIDILALPVAGPWMKIADALDFAKAVKARTAFGVHDGMIQPFFRGYVGMLLGRIVPETQYVSLQDGESKEF